MQVRCPSCQNTLLVKPQSQPSRVKCPHCATILQIPAASPAAGGPAAPARPPGNQGSAPDDLFGNLPGPPSTPSTSSTFPAAPRPSQRSRASGPAKSPRQTPRKNAKRKSGFPIWGYVVIAATALLVMPILCCGILGLVARLGTTEVVMKEGLQAIPVPRDFPDLGPSVLSFPSGVTMHRVSIKSGQTGPGANMTLRVYIPAGEHANQSVPCVLVAPAGTPMLHGASVDGDDYHDETLPYAEAGMVVIHYSIDGAIPNSVNQNDDQAYAEAMAKAYPYFKKSGGGIVNGRNALEYALAKIKIVDPNRISAAGHSSAGTLALMLAATEPRLSRCVAYAPAYDLEQRMADGINDPMTQMLLPGVKQFVQWYSPMNHIGDYQCEMMVFHARDDTNVPFSDANQFVSTMKQQGKEVMFVQANQGGHYTSMIDEGIPAAAAWLSK